MCVYSDFLSACQVGQWWNICTDRSSEPPERLLIPVGPLPPPVTPLPRERGPGEKLLALACSFPAPCELVLSTLSISLAKLPLQLLSCVWGMLIFRGISHFRLRPGSTWNVGATESCWGCRGLLGAAGGCRELLRAAKSCWGLQGLQGGCRGLLGASGGWWGLQGAAGGCWGLQGAGGAAGGCRGLQGAAGAAGGCWNWCIMDSIYKSTEHSILSPQLRAQHRIVETAAAPWRSLSALASIPVVLLPDGAVMPGWMSIAYYCGSCSLCFPFSFSGVSRAPLGE